MLDSYFTNLSVKAIQGDSFIGSQLVATKEPIVLIHQLHSSDNCKHSMLADITTVVAVAVSKHFDRSCNRTSESSFGFKAPSS